MKSVQVATLTVCKGLTNLWEVNRAYRLEGLRGGGGAQELDNP